MTTDTVSRLDLPETAGMTMNDAIAACLRADEEGRRPVPRTI
jgi:hypothetical protein